MIPVHMILLLLEFLVLASFLNAFRAWYNSQDNLLWLYMCIGTASKFTINRVKSYMDTKASAKDVSNLKED